MPVVNIIENLHLQTYTSEEHFWDELYKERYTKLFTKATDFFGATVGAGGYDIYQLRDGCLRA